MFTIVNFINLVAIYYNMSFLEINNLNVSTQDKEILKGINLKINPGEVHVIMGPNGSGKSTLAYTIMGHPKYNITSGLMTLNNIEINSLKVNERANLGIFLGFQYPSEISGVTLTQFMKQARKSDMNYVEFFNMIKSKMSELNIDDSFIKRSLNEGFSGGEKKKNEILQMAVLEPKLAILDEPDSGADVDALKLIAHGINNARKNNTAVLLITHYNRLLTYVKPDFVHILHDGKIILSGDYNLAEVIENKGYEEIIKNNGK